MLSCDVCVWVVVCVFDVIGNLFKCGLVDVGIVEWVCIDYVVCGVEYGMWVGVVMFGFGELLDWRYMWVCVGWIGWVVCVIVVVCCDLWDELMKNCSCFVGEVCVCVCMDCVWSGDGCVVYVGWCYCVNWCVEMVD